MACVDGLVAVAASAAAMQAPLASAALVPRTRPAFDVLRSLDQGRGKIAVRNFPQFFGSL